MQSTTLCLDGTKAFVYILVLLPLRVCNDVGQVSNYTILCEKQAHKVLWHCSYDLVICIDWWLIIRAVGA